MKLKIFKVNPLQVNCYLIWDEDSLQAALIDCGAFDQSEWHTIRTFIEQKELILEKVLLTHCHFDHTMGLPYLSKDYPLPLYFHAQETENLKGMSRMAARFGLVIPEFKAKENIQLNHGDEISLGKHTIQVLHTPGHTMGSVCFYLKENGILFSGDTLFMGSIGRTDLGGNIESEITSIRNCLFTLPPETAVYPGHGPSTTIQAEIASNPYF